MDELRQASSAYYNAGSGKEKKLAEKVFAKMDADGDGRVSVAEFANFLNKGELKRFDESLFNQLDKDNDGYLDFDDALLFCYIGSTRPSCDTCEKLIMGMYYSCAKCFRGDGKSFNLCPSCYSLRTYNHKHEEFLDNYALLHKQKTRSSASSAKAFGLETGGELVAGELVAEIAVSACCQM